MTGTSRGDYRLLTAQENSMETRVSMLTAHAFERTAEATAVAHIRQMFRPDGSLEVRGHLVLDRRDLQGLPVGTGRRRDGSRGRAEHPLGRRLLLQGRAFPKLTLAEEPNYPRTGATISLAKAPIASIAEGQKSDAIADSLALVGTTTHYPLTGGN